MANTTHNPNVLEIDLQGYRQTLQNKGKARILLEGWSNAADTNTTVIHVTFAQKDGWADLTVEDNDPDGFKSLKDAWTLFAASERREDTSLRGRFGQGEKELIAICCDGKEAFLTIASTTGTVTFNLDGRTEDKEAKTSLGTKLTARLKLNVKEAAEFRRLVATIIPPQEVTFRFNDKVVDRPTPVRTVSESLDTVFWNKDGEMKESTRKTVVEIFEPGPNQDPHIMELGVPVVSHPGKFHINVNQKVPLNSARDNVRPSYLRRLNEVAFNATHDLLTVEELQAGWVKDALPKASAEALKTHWDTVWGEDAVSFDPSNPEANKRAMDEGRRIVYGRSYSGDTWDRMKGEGIAKPSGQVIEVGVPTSLDGMPPIEEVEWTAGMVSLATYTRAVGEFLLGFEPEVNFYNQGLAGPNARAMWGNREIIFNLRYLGKRWPQDASQEDIDELLIHEFAHNWEADHLSDSYNRWTCRLGARLRNCTTNIREVRKS